MTGGLGLTTVRAPVGDGAAQPLVDPRPTDVNSDGTDEALVPEFVGANTLPFHLWAYDPASGLQEITTPDGAPALPRDEHDLARQGVEHLSADKELVDALGHAGVELAEHDGGMRKQLGELRTGVGAHNADFGQRQRREVQPEVQRPRGVQPGGRGEAAPREGGHEGGVDDLPTDHAAGSSATG